MTNTGQENSEKKRNLHILTSNRNANKKSLLVGAERASLSIVIPSAVILLTSPKRINAISYGSSSDGLRT